MTEAIADAVDAVACPLCGHAEAPSLEPGRCPDCDALLEPRLDQDAIAVDRETVETRPFDDLWRYAELLPLAPETAVGLGSGATPLVECPTLADRFGVASLAVKHEGTNPTGTFKDRGQALAIAAAGAAGTEHVALASAGNAGHAAAAYAARAGLQAHVFLPARAGFVQKAMVNVHGADLTVVEGRLTEAGAAHAGAMDEHPDWFSISTPDTPYRREGKKTMYYEVAEQRGWRAPDAVVYPTGGGVGLLGMAKGARELASLGWVDDEPAFFAAQSTGCAPVVAAMDAGAATVEAATDPDTICGGIEVPSVGAGREVLRVLRESGGSAVATDDDAILDAALTVAETEGVALAPEAAATISGLEALVDRGELGADDEVVVLGTGTGLKHADVLRSQLMSQGI
ncbi:MAG: threonine synthase [Halobacteriales archaeon]